MHISIPVEHSCEFIEVTAVSPLMSKCQIKVCYVSDEPNRNKSVITKEVATEMANSLPGCPIVGLFNEAEEDFEEHNKQISIGGGKVTITDSTKAYGFVPTDAKVWFQKFLDDGTDEREYLMTEGYIWTGQFKESQRIIDKGNNQSMELHPGTIDGTWTKDGNGKPQFFIISEAVIGKLCILGENIEPCFEGAQITDTQFALNEFKNTLTVMVNEFKAILNEGGDSMELYAIEIGCELWNSLYSYLEANYPEIRPDGSRGWCSKYRIQGVYEEGASKFAIMKDSVDNRLYKLDFSVGESNALTVEGEPTEVTQTFTETSAQFSLEDIEAYEQSRYAAKEKEKEEEEKKGQEPKKDPDDSSKKKEDDEDEKSKSKYSLEEIPEYTALQAQYSELETKFSQLEENYSKLEESNTALTEFKNSVELKSKQEMIEGFYMLSDEDKADVVTNINTYSLDDIEAKLAIICVRNKVSFSLEDETKKQDGLVFNLENQTNTSTGPAWLQAVKENSKNK